MRNEIRTVRLLLSIVVGWAMSASVAAAGVGGRPLCDDNAALCTEQFEYLNYEGQYTGHDEPSLLFYSAVPGSGNSNTYLLRLPKDPPVLPRQDGTGGTFNFQLRPAFWFGMALCDTQSAPNPGTGPACIPDSDTNIFDGADPTAPDYIGKHPGTAFMEMQFYPPGWVAWPPGVSCDATHWCAALNIDSLSQNLNTGATLNPTCADRVGVEYVNFAFITKDGVPLGPPNPVNATLATLTPNLSRQLLMDPGDVLVVDMRDTPSGFQVIIRDLTTGESGSMVASAANGFGQVLFAPTGTACVNIPYDFHPMYSTSSEHTRVPWTAHSYNVAFSDEIGHFEFCDAVDANGNCVKAGVTDPGGVDDDDFGCFPASASTRIQVSGCLGTDQDFDGPDYGLNWPGTFTNPGLDQRFHARPVMFSSPLFTNAQTGALQNYSRVAFETDLPRIEVPNGCNRSTGAGCTNPPPGATFYPIYTTRGPPAHCTWQLGGAYVPGTTNTFGGNSTAEYGALLSSLYPGVGNVPIHRFNNFRQVLSSNPCPTFGILDDGY